MSTFPTEAYERAVREEAQRVSDAIDYAVFSEALTTAKLLAARELLDEADAFDGPHYIVVSPRQLRLLRGGGQLKHGRRYTALRARNNEAARCRSVLSRLVGARCLN